MATFQYQTLFRTPTQDAAPAEVVPVFFQAPHARPQPRSYDRPWTSWTLSTEAGADPAGTQSQFFAQPPGRRKYAQFNPATGQAPARGSFPPAFPDNPYAGGDGDKNFVHRDPKPDRRSARHEEQTANILNSLIRRGELVQTATRAWRLNPPPAVAAGFAPATDDDVGDGYMVGQMWIDTTAGNVWVCVNNASGAAVWKNVS